MGSNATTLQAGTKKGEIPSYEAFYERYYSLFCRRLGRQWANRQIAEDFVTDGFVHLWEHYGKFRTEKAALTFLVSGIRMACRKSDLKNFAPIDGEDGPWDRGVPDPASGLRLEWSQVAEGLDRVSPRHQKIFFLYYRYGYSIRQISQELHSSPSSIQNKLAWSIYILKKYFLKPKAPV